MFRRLAIKSTLCASGIAGLCAATAAAAQQVPEPAAANTSSTIGDIVVTAQKRAERIQNVPISIAAVNASSLTAAGVRSTESLSSVVPGVVITRSNAVPLIYIRGVGTQNSSPGEEGSNGVYIDGVLISSLPAAVLGLSNIERVEVLKGPQGTLFGRNATGGIINIITRTPSFDPGIEYSFGFGSYRTVDTNLYATTPLSSRVAIDLAASYHNQGDGYGKNIFDGSDVYKSRETSVRSKLLWNATDTTKITLAGDYNNVRSSFGNGRTVLPGAIAAGGTVYTGHFYDTNNNWPSYGINKQWGVSGKIEQDLGWATIVNLAAYRHVSEFASFDSDGTPLSVVNFSSTRPTRQFTEEFQLQSASSSRIKWIAGLFYLDGEAFNTPSTIVGSGAGTGSGGLSVTNSTMRTKSYAAFGQTTVPLGESTNITAGLRYTRDERRFNGTRSIAGGVVVTTVNTGKNFEKLTYRFAVDRKLNQDILLYTSYSRGFKSGLYNLSTITNPVVNPETLDAAEVGFKSDLFDRHLRFNLAGFRYWYKDVQLVQNIGGFSNILNAARAKVLGLDGEVVVAPVEHLKLNIGGTVLFDAKYTNFPGAPYSLNNGAPVPPGVTCPPQPIVPVGGNRPGCTIDGSGQRMIRAPKLTLNSGINYDYAANIGTFTFSANYAYNSGFFFEPDNRLRQPKYGLLSGQIGWRDVNDHIGIRLSVRNLLNKKYYQLLSSSSADLYAAGQPRLYGAAMDVKF